jgi:hypothetical protein
MIVVNLDKAKAVAHGLRRAARAKEFAPYDDILSKQIPGQSAVEAENARAAIREKYTAIQSAIDMAGDVEELKSTIVFS